MAGMGLREIYPQSLTHLYLDRPGGAWPLRANAAERAVIRICRRFGHPSPGYGLELNWGETAAGDADIREQWVWQRIYF